MKSLQTRGFPVDSKVSTAPCNCRKSTVQLDVQLNGTVGLAGASFGINCQCAHTERLRELIHWRVSEDDFGVGCIDKVSIRAGAALHHLGMSLRDLGMPILRDNFDLLFAALLARQFQRACQRSHIRPGKSLMCWLPQ